MDNVTLRATVGWISFLLFIFVRAPVWAQYKYAIIPENPMPGEPVTIGLSTAANIKSAVLYTSAGKRLAQASFFTLQPADDKPTVTAAVLTVPSTADAGFALINIESDTGIFCKISLVIKERKFISEVIELNSALTEIRADPSPQKTAESLQLWNILNRTGTEIYNAGTFTAPVQSTRRTSFFGDRRVFKYSTGETDASIHAGVDYGVPTGTPVTACGAGKVVLARSRIVTGNSVIIEHAPGIYSLYYHLDKIEITEGALVMAGALLGQSGATGLATGPHLHWEIRVSGENTDPDAFIHRPILDKDAILAKISN
jgi:murein DD-endopeptidase MepM/ murein hydrolase activator NlpD